MDAPQYKSIEYQFRDQRLYEDYYALFSIGWEYWASPEVYYRDCRTSAYKQCVFQYTVSGEGTLVYNQKAYAIKPGQAFLIERARTIPVLPLPKCETLGTEIYYA